MDNAISKFLKKINFWFLDEDRNNYLWSIGKSLCLLKAITLYAGRVDEIQKLFFIRIYYKNNLDDLMSWEFKNMLRVKN